MNLSIIIPAFNEKDRITVTLESLREYFTRKDYSSYEILVVDDGSRDGTADLVRSYAKNFPAIKVIENGVNRGKGYSVCNGMMQAKGNYRLFMDADNSVSITNLDEFLHWVKEGYDVVIGSIKVGNASATEHAGWHRRILGNISKVLIRNIAVPGIKDTQRGFKLFSAKAAQEIFPKQTIDRFGFDIEILVIAWLNKFKIKELPVVWDNPSGSKVTLWSYVQTFRELMLILRNRFKGKYYSAERTSTKLEKHEVRKTGTFAPVGIFASLANYVNGPEHDKDMIPLSPKAGKGRGFSYKGQEYVHHSDLHHYETAFYNLIRRQKFVLAGIVAFLLAAIALNWHVFLIVGFSLLTVLYFFDLLFNAYVIFRTFRHRPEIKISAQEISDAETIEWPSYTIFCPLYKEWQVVPQFAEAMQKLDYPHDKLQIMFLLEENDQETIDKVRTAGLPSYFEIVVVPHSKPKTKPKAMNYGLSYATGEYLVIYDAEDQPEPDQLKKAVLAFRKSKDEVACVQAKLNFYNPTQNILTRIFTAEYSLWFDLVLPGLQSISAPIPLGGTSNHFRTDTLRRLSGWDAFNVTEDCDLGMRLANRGYRTAIIESTTHEEANSDALNWYNQRSRWIKGYIITYFVHMRKPLSAIREGKGRDLFLFQLIVGGKIVSLFINPIMWVSTIMYFAFRAKFGVFIESLFPGPILYIGVFSLIFGNFLYLYYYMIGCANRGYNDLIKYIFIVPLYWLGMSLAAWKAVYEVIVKPHYWSKTKHGLHLPATAQASSVPHARVTRIATTQPLMASAHSAPFTMVTPALTIPMVRATEVAPVEKKVPIDTPVIAQRVVTTKKITRITSTRFSFMKSGAVLLIVSSVVANILNFVFNAYLGRALTLEEFGIVSMMSVFAYLLNLFIGALSTTVTHAVSYLEGAAAGSGSAFFVRKWMKVFIISMFGSVLWFLVAPFIGGFFQISTQLVIIAFAPAILFGSLDAFNKGYLQGTFSFGMVAVTALLETTAKLAIAVLFVASGHASYVAFAIPISIYIVCIGSSIFAITLYRNTVKGKEQMVRIDKTFPVGFYLASLMSGVSVAAFLSIDVILAKHYLSPEDAGRYGMLSLVGKMIFFFGSLLNVFIVSLVSRAEGRHRNPKNDFAMIYSGTMFLTLSAGITLSMFAPLLVPLLLGPQAISIVAYVPAFSLSMCLFTLTTTLVLYNLARKRFFFSYVSLCIAAAMLIGIIRNHGSISEMVSIILSTDTFYFVIVLIVSIFYGPLAYFYRNIVDILSVFRALPRVAEALPGRMSILIFNWRDTESVFAGGAETYIQALASNWVKHGHAVTLFTSNDGKQEQNGEIDGVRVIRRGGFFAVYIAAAVYYLFRFRGKFDAIVDCENGIPFFTPLYAREPVYCLVHHVHQEVFRRALPRPLAAFACFLEKYMVPLVYRKSEFITVSESSKHEMLAIKMTSNPIHIVYPGVDLAFLKPGKKSLTPLVAYVGRLKDYKSIDLLIKAFAGVVKKIPTARLQIAGDGDEQRSLTKLAAKLQLSDVITFSGKVSEDEKLSILQSAWVFVNPSMMEGWGITTIEANACGTPVVASDVPGLRDSVRNGETGFLVPYKQTEMLSEKIALLIHDNQLRNTLSRNAVQWAENFDWQKSSDRFIDIVGSSRASSHNYHTQLIKS